MTDLQKWVARMQGEVFYALSDFGPAAVDLLRLALEVRPAANTVFAHVDFAHVDHGGTVLADAVLGAAQMGATS